MPPGESGSGSIGADEVLVAADGVLVSDVEDELVMLDQESDEYYGLNPVGAFLWDRLEEPQTVRELEAATASEFDVARDRCRDDVRAFLADLLDAGLAERV